MKIAFFNDYRLGVVAGDSIVDVSAEVADVPHTGPGNLISNVIGAWDDLGPRIAAAAARGAKLPLASVTLRPPLPRPGNIVCMAVNYMEDGTKTEPAPINAFQKASTAIIGPGDTMVLPDVAATIFEGEAELALIIGKKATQVSAADAMDYVFGYSIFNDVSVRDYQFRVTQYTGGKNFRSSGPFGPVIVTADELTDPHRLDIRTTINGEVMQSANTDTMVFDIPTILEHIADFIDLEAGDVIPMGTPAGVGFKRKPPIFLKDGDTVSIEISGIGTLTNPVVNETAP